MDNIFNLFGENNFEDYEERNNLIEIITSYIESHYNASVSFSYDPIFLDELYDEDDTENIHADLSVNFFIANTQYVIDLELNYIIDLYEMTGLENTLDEITHHIDSEILYLVKRTFYRF